MAFQKRHPSYHTEKSKQKISETCKKIVGFGDGTKNNTKEQLNEFLTEKNG